MARAGLDKNRKFLRLAQGLNAVLPGMADVLARGLLETLWSTVYERADDHLGDADDVEIAAGWRGERGMLANLLLHAGGNGASGFIEADADRGGYKIHAFWEHAPPWVKVKADRAAARAAAGKSIADVRREAGRVTQFKAIPATDSDSARQTVDSLPESVRQKTARDGTGRDGTGSPPVSPLQGEPTAPLSLAPDPPKPTREERKANVMREHRETAARALDVFNAERERLRLGGALRPTDGNLAEIVRRLRDGATLDECEHVIRAAAYEVEQGGEPKWFNPATLFRASTWPVRLAAYAPPKPAERDPEAEARAEASEAERARRRVLELTA